MPYGLPLSRWKVLCFILGKWRQTYTDKSLIAFIGLPRLMDAVKIKLDDNKWNRQLKILFNLNTYLWLVIKTDRTKKIQKQYSNKKCLLRKIK